MQIYFGAIPAFCRLRYLPAWESVGVETKHEKWNKFLNVFFSNTVKQHLTQT